MERAARVQRGNPGAIGIGSGAQHTLKWTSAALANEEREIQEDRGLECNWQAQLTEQWRTGTAAVHGASSASLHTADKLSLSLSRSPSHTSLSFSFSSLGADDAQLHD